MARLLHRDGGADRGTGLAGPRAAVPPSENRTPEPPPIAYRPPPYDHLRANPPIPFTYRRRIARKRKKHRANRQNHASHHDSAIAG